MAGNVIYPVSPYQLRPPFMPPGDLSGLGGGGGGGLLQAIHPVQMTPPQVNPGTDEQGNDTLNVSPASIPPGFLNRLIAGRQGQMQVNQINAAMQEERLRQLGQLLQIKEQGKQTRETLTSGQMTKMLSDHNLPDTPKNRDFLANAYSAIQQQIEQGKAQNMLDVQQSPQGQKAMTDSSMGTLMMPAFAAQQASKVSASPGETVAYNRPDNLQGNPNILQGDLSKSTTSQLAINPNYNKPGHEGEPMMIPVQTGSSQMFPGSLQQPMSDEDKAKYQQLQDTQNQQQTTQYNNQVASPNPTGLPSFMGMPQAPPSVQQPSMVPNQPNPMPGIGQQLSQAFGGNTAGLGDYLSILMGLGNVRPSNNPNQLPAPTFNDSPVY